MQKDKSIIIRNGIAVKQYSLMEQPNQSKRPYMEDTSFVIDCFLDSCPKSLLFGIFDGHGGYQVSQFLEKHLPSTVKDYYKKYKNNLKQGFQKMNEKIKDNIEKAKEIGSTATVGLILLEQSKRVLYIANVGDSSAYLFDNNNAEKIVTDHRGDNTKEIARVKQNGGTIFNNRLVGTLAVTRAFGDFLYSEYGLTVIPDVKKIQLRLSHKYMVVATDGLWDYVQIKQVHKILKQQLDTPQIAKILIKTAITRGSSDNITILVLKL